MRWSTCTMLAALCASHVAGAVPAAAQQPFGYFFGAPRQAPRSYPPRRRVPVKRIAPPMSSEIPLPPPRPHFPGDPPPADTAGTAPATAAREPEPKAGPPEAPIPTAPAVPSAADAPKPPAASAAKPPAVVVSPVPEELPVPGKPRRVDKAAEPERIEVPTASGNERPKAPPATGSPTGEPAPPPASVATAPPISPPLPPQKPADLKNPGAPGVAPSGARLGETPGQPVDDAACPGRLKARNVDVEPITIGPQPDERCTVVQAVRLTGLTLPDGGKVAFPDRPTIACTTADAFSFYVRDLLVPLAKGTFGAPVTTVWTGPGLECRSRDHIFGAKLSAHGQGLAIDIAQLKLADGRVIAVGEPKGDVEQGFETASRAAACGYFHTVLGPGSDSYHRTHWHFDLEVRGSQGDGKYCK